MKKDKCRNNKKTVIILAYVSILVVGIIVVCVVLANRAKKDLPNYAVTDPAFVDYFSNEDDIDSLRVSSLNSYYLNGKTYYVVEYMHDGEDFQYKLLYILMGPSKRAFFPIKNESECYTYFPNEYEAYLNAKKDGVAREYSSEEIAEMINSFYGREIIK